MSKKIEDIQQLRNSEAWQTFKDLITEAGKGQIVELTKLDPEYSKLAFSYKDLLAFYIRWCEQIVQIPDELLMEYKDKITQVEEEDVDEYVEKMTQSLLKDAEKYIKS